MLKLKSHGSIAVESAAITALVILSLAFITYYFERNKETYRDIFGRAVNKSPEVQKARKEAKLIVVGRIRQAYQNFKVEGHGAQRISGMTYYELEVDTVEKGMYNDRMIKVAMSWFSNFTPPQVFSPFIKKDYRRGEQVRIFLDYSLELGYFTPYLWYTIEPVT